VIMPASITRLAAGHNAHQNTRLQTLLLQCQLK